VVVKKQRRHRPVRVPNPDRAERNLPIIPRDYYKSSYNPGE